MFVVPPPPANEAARLEFLFSCGILDTPKDERFDRLTRLAARFYGADVAFLGFVDDRYQWMKSATSDGVAPWIERDKSVCQIMIATGRPLVFGDMQSDPRLEGHPIVPHLPFRFYAGVPLLTEDGAAVASLCVLKREAQDPSAVDLEPLSDLAAIAMDELELFRRNRELARLAETCPLTGLANRRGFDAALDRAVRRARRTRAHLSLLLLDLDHFKRLNDTLGHQAGDEALRRFGTILGAAARRPDDVAARYGGEEFALILPDTDAAGAVEVAGMVRQALVSAAIPHPDGIGGLVTASIGIATASPDALPDPDTLLSQADAALYRAKHSGRDCYCVSDCTS
ncbi:sensor domain-containing diguanylate cyclase [Microvirga thermotolerans]|uniref:diguanylate cyclase n=1 Tax=Microvirga thermotolerans TaxID=2651334 RepID=A0A5P9JWY2_9HYPH|nr:diguanylate cyclase [Microvirga thermotolerans]QFU16943.1 diguanylate cyclase [Microvirga thermotolerans]